MGRAATTAVALTRVAAALTKVVANSKLGNSKLGNSKLKKTLNQIRMRRPLLLKITLQALPKTTPKTVATAVEEGLVVGNHNNQDQDQDQSQSQSQNQNLKSSTH